MSEPSAVKAKTNTDALPQSVDELIALPWVRALLTAPGTTTFVPQSRDPANTHPHDRFFGKTLNNPDGIPTCVCFFHGDAPGRAPIAEISTLFALSRGVDGYPNVAHGGLVGVLVDEVLGILIQHNMNTDRDGPVFKMDTVTASMGIKYLKPIVTPGVVLGVGRIKEISGKRLLLGAVIKDANGVELATCDAVWIALPRPKM
ncbi:Verlamelin biosynthesis protein B [Colletotrichum orbiculare MAFF 240422]|uniref:Verlamelin biosynthesis protein B n=1 Tax=Colletotrichum orbiculare (strain 104-T / ATCC 96160 / CBS 514.97 / LARS 414 / MAFF 240422) TaxID=1213857 RepID=N4VE84_COLOR|nr:Verlamelin biosynthesis protein B [Colletotrichum orbiculare MAFF 240422]